MNGVNIRIHDVRLFYEMSMEKFGARIGITRSSVNSLEKGKNNPSDQTIKLICKEFNVDYFWLTEGKGDMLTAFPETIIDEVIDQFKLDKSDKAILQAYVNLTDTDRKAVKNFLLSIAENAKEESD